MFFITSMLEDDNGGISSTRFIFVVGSLLILLVWTWLCLKNGEFVAIPLKDLGILGVLITGKVGNKAFEAMESGKSATKS